MSAVSVEERGEVAVVTLDRPPANAFDLDFVKALREKIRKLSGARALVLASANPKLFSAGFDLPVLFSAGREEMRIFLTEYCGLVRDLFAFPAPAVAALPGHAIAGGLILAAAADERLAADGPGRFGLSEVALGVPVPACCLEVFRYLLGPRDMERLAASAENVAGERALAMGLIDRIVPAGDLFDAALERARTLARGAPAAHAAVKSLARKEALARFDAALEDDSFLEFWFTADARDRITALIEKLTGKKPSSSLSS